MSETGSMGKSDSNTFIHLAGFSAFVSLYMVLFGPLDIFVHNSEEFSSDPAELITALLLMAGASFFVILIVLSLSPRKIKNILFRAFALVVIGAWAISNFFYGEYGQLDGKELVIEKWSMLAVVQSVVLLVLLLLIVILDIGKVRKLTGIVFLLGLISSVVGFLSLDNRGDNIPAVEFPESLTQFSPTMNVLHVVLDEMGSRIFIHALESDSELKKAFDGFTIFSDTLSIYPSTEMSIAVLMTGEVYRNDVPKKAFMEQLRKQNMGVEQLEILGYELDSHTMCRLGVVHRCTPANSLILNENVADIEALQLLDIFLFKSVPDYLKPEVYNHEKWLLLNISNHNEYLKFQSGVAHLLFKKFIEDISVSDSPIPRYKFFHSLVTHVPVNLDSDCYIVDKETSTKENNVDFIKCGLGHFVALLDKLKALDIYDETMIVLSSDHGDYWIDESVKWGKFKERGIRVGATMRASAALAIKPFNARGTVTQTEAPVSLRDIPETILAANGLGQKTSTSVAFEPRDVFSVSPTDNREREYLHYVWDHKYWAEEILPPITTYKINGRIKDPQSWPDHGSTVRSQEQ